MRKEHHAVLGDAKVQMPATAWFGNWWNLVAVEDIGVVVRDKFEGVRSSIFWRMFYALQRSLCFAKFLALGYKMQLKPCKLERNTDGRRIEKEKTSVKGILL